jgi:hypothetical protein
MARAEALLGAELLGDCVNLEIGEVETLRVVSDNCTACESNAFWRSIASRPEARAHSHPAPRSNTNGVVERYRRSLKYEHLRQREIANAAELAEEVADYVRLFKKGQPRETLGQRRPNGVHRGLTPVSGRSVQNG